MNEILIIEIFAVITLAVVILAPLTVFVEWLYYRRLVKQMKWRAELSGAILKQSIKLKDNFNLTQKQKDFLNKLLDVSDSKLGLRSFFKVLGFFGKSIEHGEQISIEKILGTKGIEKLLPEITIFAMLCVLQASTYNFILGPFLRKKIILSVLQQVKPVEAPIKHTVSDDVKKLKVAARRKDFLKRPTVYSIFKSIDENNLKTA